MKDLIIIGARGLARELLSYAIDIMRIGFLTDYPDDLDNYDTGYTILGPIAGHTIRKNAVYICAMGDGNARLTIGRAFQEKVQSLSTLSTLLRESENELR